MNSRFSCIDEIMIAIERQADLYKSTPTYIQPYLHMNIPRDKRATGLTVQLKGPFLE